MAVEARTIQCSDGDATLVGELFWAPSAKAPAPGVLVVHTWGGCGAFERAKARDLAGAGYVAVAVDLYGDGRVGSGPEENAALMAPLLEDRSLLQRRMRRWLETLQAAERVDRDRTAAIGFCFGGLCVLDLARTGAETRAVVSFHGLLQPPGNCDPGPIRAKVLVLHGWDDPMATPPAVEALAAELTAAGADWQIHAYGGTMHAFTNPAARNPAAGTVYDARADSRSRRAMADFLAEAFGEAP